MDQNNSEDGHFLRSVRWKKALKNATKAALGKILLRLRKRSIVFLILINVKTINLFN